MMILLSYTSSGFYIAVPCHAIHDLAIKYTEFFLFILRCLFAKGKVTDDGLIDSIKWVQLNI